MHRPTTRMPPNKSYGFPSVAHAPSENVTLASNSSRGPFIEPPIAGLVGPPLFLGRHHMNLHEPFFSMKRVKTKRLDKCDDILHSETVWQVLRMNFAKESNA